MQNKSSTHRNQKTIKLLTYLITKTIAEKPKSDRCINQLFKKYQSELDESSSSVPITTLPSKCISANTSDLNIDLIDRHKGFLVDRYVIV